MPDTYKVLGPHETMPDGRGYPELLGQWTEWVLGPDPDNNNEGNPIWFSGSECSNNSYGQTIYSRKFVLRVGSNSLSPIPKDKYVFIPVITAIADSIDNPCSDSEQSRRMYALNEIDEGPVPKTSQIEIDGKPIILNSGENDLRNYKICSPQVFPLIEGGGPKLCSEPPIKPRDDYDRRLFVAVAYCVVLYDLSIGYHTITSFAVGARNYTAGLMYNINVLPPAEPKLEGAAKGTPTRGDIEARLTSFKKDLMTELERMKNNGFISDGEHELCSKHLKSELASA